MGVQENTYLKIETECGSVCERLCEREQNRVCLDFDKQLNVTEMPSSFKEWQLL